ncbi:hypothetical protein BGW38_005217, partial [Lunasporangiospora selenospora]
PVRSVTLSIPQQLPRLELSSPLWSTELYSILTPPSAAVESSNTITATIASVSSATANAASTVVNQPISHTPPAALIPSTTAAVASSTDSLTDSSALPSSQPIAPDSSDPGLRPRTWARTRSTTTTALSDSSSTSTLAKPLTSSLLGHVALEVDTARRQPQPARSSSFTTSASPTALTSPSQQNQQQQRQQHLLLLQSPSTTPTSGTGLWRSQSSSQVLDSPNQLQGIVIDSLKTPIQLTSTAAGEGFKDTLGLYTSRTHPADILFDKRMDPAPVGGEEGGVGSTSLGGWAGFRKRSRSTGTIGATTPSWTTTTYAAVAAAAMARITGSSSRSSLSTPSPPKTGSTFKGKIHRSKDGTSTNNAGKNDEDNDSEDIVVVVVDSKTEGSGSGQDNGNEPGTRAMGNPDATRVGTVMSSTASVASTTRTYGYPNSISSPEMPRSREQTWSSTHGNIIEDDRSERLGDDDEDGIESEDGSGLGRGRRGSASLKVLHPYHQNPLRALRRNDSVLTGGKSQFSAYRQSHLQNSTQPQKQQQQQQQQQQQILGQNNDQHSDIESIGTDQNLLEGSLNACSRTCVSGFYVHSHDCGRMAAAGVVGMAAGAGGSGESSQKGVLSGQPLHSSLREPDLEGQDVRGMHRSLSQSPSQFQSQPPPGIFQRGFFQRNILSFASLPFKSAGPPATLMSAGTDGYMASSPPPRSDHYYASSSSSSSPSGYTIGSTFQGSNASSPVFSPSIPTLSREHGHSDDRHLQVHSPALSTKTTETMLSYVSNDTAISSAYSSSSYTSASMYSTTLSYYSGISQYSDDTDFSEHMPPDDVLAMRTAARLSDSVTPAMVGDQGFFNRFCQRFTQWSWGFLVCQGQGLEGTIPEKDDEGGRFEGDVEEEDEGLSGIASRTRPKQQPNKKDLTLFQSWSNSIRALLESGFFIHQEPPGPSSARMRERERRRRQRRQRTINNPSQANATMPVTAHDAASTQSSDKISLASSALSRLKKLVRGVPATRPLSPSALRSLRKRMDAKSYFSNERTFIHWIKFGLLLGSMALTLLSFGEGTAGENVGLFLVLVAMAVLVYAMAIFHLRHEWLKALRTDVLYYDRVGPSILFGVLFLAYATNVALTIHKLYDKEVPGINFLNNGPLDV